MSREQPDIVEVGTWIERAWAPPLQRLNAAILADWRANGGPREFILLPATGSAPTATSAQIHKVAAVETDPPVLAAHGSGWPLDQTAARLCFPNTWTDPHPWQAGDASRLQWIRSIAADMTGRVIDALLALPDDITGTAIAAEANLPSPRALPPVLRALAELCRRVERRPLWDPHRRDGTWHYNVFPVVRAFSQV